MAQAILKTDVPFDYSLSNESLNKLPCILVLNGPSLFPGSVLKSTLIPEVNIIKLTYPRKGLWMAFLGYGIYGIFPHAHEGGAEGVAGLGFDRVL